MQDTGKPPNRRYTLDERCQIQYLLDKGHSRKDIACALGRHIKSLQKEISACVRAHGKYDAEAAHSLHPVKVPGPKTRLLSLAQIALIKEGFARGISLHGIASLAHTSRRKVTEYARQHGITLQACHLWKKTRSPEDEPSFEQRILFLEEQVKILSETLKDLICRK